MQCGAADYTLAGAAQLTAGGQDVGAFAFAQHGGEVPVQQNLLKCRHVFGGRRFERRSGVFIKDDQI